MPRKSATAAVTTKEPVQRRTRREAFNPLMATLEWARTRVLRESSQKREDEYKKMLMTFLEAEGDVAEGGHRTYLFDQPIENTGLKTAPTIIGIKRERREVSSLDEDRVMALLAKKDLVARCTAQVTVINEDALLAANFDGTITDKELASLYTKNESFAFVPIKQK